MRFELLATEQLRRTATYGPAIRRGVMPLPICGSATWARSGTSSQESEVVWLIATTWEPRIKGHGPGSHGSGGKTSLLVPRRFQVTDTSGRKVTRLLSGNWPKRPACPAN